MTDHYTYLYDDKKEMTELSGLTGKSKLLLEKTPCFIWSPDAPAVQVEKTLNTADLVPTLMNLMGVNTPWEYLGCDAFDPSYPGYVIFPNGDWIRDGVVMQKGKVVENPSNVTLSEAYLQEMSQLAQEFVHISNILLTSDYYEKFS